MSSLPAQCKISSQLFKFAPLLRGELVSPKLNVDLVERAAERERHLRVVFVDDRRPSVLPDIETLVEREPERLGQLDATLGHLPAIDRERSGSGLADAAAIVCEIKNDGVFARRERLRTRDAVLVLLLVGVLVAVLVGEGVGEHRFAVEHEQTPAAEPPTLRHDHAVSTALGNLNIGRDAE